MANQLALQTKTYQALQVRSCILTEYHKEMMELRHSRIITCRDWSQAAHTTNRGASGSPNTSSSFSPLSTCHNYRSIWKLEGRIQQREKLKQQKGVVKSSYHHR
jgi:hypothetical protein